MPSGPHARDSESTRSRILDRLRRAPATVDELAGLVELTRNGVRAQLAVLERDGLVFRQGVRHSPGAGKPAHVFAITALAEERFSRAYPPALTALVDAVAESVPDAAFRRALESAGKRLALELRPSGERGSAAIARGVLETLGAVVTVSTVRGNPVIEGAACPLARVVRRRPECCELVRTLLATSTGADVEMRCHHGERPRCRFVLR